MGKVQPSARIVIDEVKLVKEVYAYNKLVGIRVKHTEMHFKLPFGSIFGPNLHWCLEH